MRGCRLSIHSRRRSRTSARSRSGAISCFFIGEPGVTEPARERGRACDHVALHLKRAGQFGHGDVRLGLDAPDQKGLVGGPLPAPARAPPVGRLNRPCSVRPLEKLDGATRADPKMPGRVTARMPGPHVPHDARPQIQGITLAHDRSPDHEESSIAAPVTPSRFHPQARRSSQAQARAGLVSPPWLFASPPGPRICLAAGSGPGGVGPPGRFSLSQFASRQRRTRACPALQTLTVPDLTAEYQPEKLASTETRQPFKLGSFRVTLAFGASGPERVSTFAPTRTATPVAGTARPFTIVRTLAERGVSRPDGAPLRGAASAADGGLPVVAGSGAGAASMGPGLSRTGDVVGAVVGAASSGGWEGGTVAGGAAGATSTGSGASSEPASVCASAAADDSVAKKMSRARAARINGWLWIDRAANSHLPQGGSHNPRTPPRSPQVPPGYR